MHSLIDGLIICDPLIHQPIEHIQERFTHLQGLDLADLSTGVDQLKLDVLLGSDLYWKIATGEVRRGTCGPIAIDTILGWVLSGPIRDNHPIESFVNLTSVHTLHIDTVPSLDSQLSQFWELESLGIPNQEPSVQTRFESSLSFN